jgi:hypothetical protein
MTTKTADTDAATEAAGLERLRAAKAELDLKREEEGHQAGREWALKDAGADDLETLTAFAAPIDNNEEITAEAVQSLLGDEYTDFWTFALGDDHQRQTRSSAFVGAFVTAALAVWRQV